MATGNHWWLDGIVGVTVLAICAWAVFGGADRLAGVRRPKGLAAAGD